MKSNGSLTVNPTTVGTDTYTLFCSNVAGDSQPASVTLTVTAAAPPPSSGGGGGGSLEFATLLGLLGIWMTATARAMRSR
jgi:hypothetical protein